MRRQLLTVLCAATVVVAPLLVEDARASGTPHDSLYYMLNTDSAFVDGTRDTANSNLEIATLSFDWLLKDTSKDSINSIMMLFTYDTTLLTFLEARADTISWPHRFYINDTTYVGDTATVTLIWDSAKVAVPADTITFCYLDFTPKCQAELTANAVRFASSANNQTQLDDLFHSPASGNYTDGSVVTDDYDGSYWIPDVTLQGNAGDSVWVPVLATKNYKSGQLYFAVTYDTTRLEYLTLTIPDDSARWSFSLTSANADSVVAILRGEGEGNNNEFDNDSVIVIAFKVLCDDPDFNESTAIDFKPSAMDPVGNCSQIDESAFSSTTGGVAFNNSVVIKAVQESGAGLGSVVGKSSEDSVSYLVSMHNTSAVGNVNTTPGQNNGIQLGFDFGNDGFQLNTTAVTSLSPGVAWRADDGGGSGALVYQVDSTQDYIAPVSDTANILKVYFDWNPSDFKPSEWSDRSFVPKLAHRVTTPVPDTLYAELPDTNDCLVADSINNGLLTFVQPTDSIEVLLGEYSTVGYYNSSSACSYTDLYVRGNFNIGVCSLLIRTANSQTCIYSVNYMLTGVTATKISDTLWKIKTDTSFGTISAADTTVRLCRLNSGIAGGCLPNKTLTVAVLIDTPNVYIANTDSADQYVVVAHASGAQAKCSSAGNGCFDCAGGGPPPKLDKIGDETALPQEFALHQNFPNPFNPATKIRLDMPVASEWVITVYNVMGQTVDEFYGESGAGTVTVEWDARGRASGMYFYKAVAGDFSQTRKMILLK